ncbi:MAG: HAMP domain-containing protein [Alicyclobacillus sp.]|nr:HAMP domain-containing protein [Alicyclobacillus sp.]
MKVRQKLFLAMASLVVLTSVAFFSISHGYLTGLFRQYATAARQSDAEVWASWLEIYYANEGTWAGVNPYILSTLIGQHPMTTGQIVSMVVYNASGRVVAEVGAPPAIDTGRGGNASDTADMVSVPLVVSGRKVGELEIRDRGIEGQYRVEHAVLHSALIATVWGTLVTAIIALLMGAWFSRWVTRPLLDMIQGMRRIGAGDLDTKLSVPTGDEFGEVAEAFNEMTDRLSRTEQARKHLVADVAHELRMPLTIMQGQLELIQQGVKSAGPESLLPIQDEVFRLTRLVQDLHQLSLAEVGQLTLERQWVDPAQLIGRVVDNFEVEFEDHQIAFRSEAHLPEGTQVFVDPDRITQVFVNLLGNAVRYTPDGGSVTVTARIEAGDVRVDVSDTGPGIDPEHLPHVFDRFYRADEDRSRQKGGTGLGLAIAKEFVEAHQGRISVASKVGEGTTFTVWLPTKAPASDSPS